MFSTRLYLIITAILPLALPGFTLGLDLYVAPDGSDAWTGTVASPNETRGDGPFASIERARDEIRKRKAAGILADESVIVHLRGGLYTLATPFSLAAEDSGTKQAPITYRSYQREVARLIGGREITGFKPVTDQAIIDRLEPVARNKLYQADLKSQGVSDLGDAVAAGQRLELFFQDKPMPLSRWPNEGFIKIAGLVGGEPIQSHGFKGDKIGKFTYEGDRPKRWGGEPDIRLLGYWFWDWADAYQKVQTIDTDKRIIAIVPPYHIYGYRAGQRYYALNLLSEIDSPGEWYLNRQTGILYFWPPAPLESSKAFVSLLPGIISMRDVSYVTIRGIQFEFCHGTAVSMNGGINNLIAGCTLRNLGGQAVAINGGTANGVIGCDIYDTGDGGISLTGGDRNKLVPGRHYAINNHIHDYSRTSKTYRTAVSTHGIGNRIAHNLIHDAPHMAIGLSGNEHVIEFNEVHTVCMDTDDAGAFYMGRDWTWRGNVIRHNYFHHIGQFKSWVGVQAIYLDDWASASTVYGNICYKAGRAVLVGGGRNNTIDNNVFVDCTPAVHIDSRALGWAKSFFDDPNNSMLQALKAIPYREPPWSTRYPELLTLYDDEPALAKYNVVIHNICIGGKWLDLHDGLTDKVVTVKDNLVNTDPHFVDVEQQNFQIKDDSPALSLGFKRIPVEKIGPYQDEYRASWPIERKSPP